MVQATNSLVAEFPPAPDGSQPLPLAAQAWLVSYVHAHPDATLGELNQAWQAGGGRPVGQTCIWQVLHEHRLRRKKKPARHGARH